MWWTDDSQAVKNSVLRAISGGPVYVSDKLDRSREDVLKPLALSNQNTRYFAFRPPFKK